MLKKSNLIPKDIPGHLSVEEGEWLAEKAEGKIVVEIGAYRGRSTCYIASKASKVISCDAFCGQKKLRTGQKCVDFDEVKEEWYENIKGCGFNDHVKLYENFSEEVYPILMSNYHGKIDLVFVDGGHDKSTLRVDVRYANLLCKDGIIAFHDYWHPMYPDVQFVVNAWGSICMNEVDSISSVGRIGAFKVKQTLNIPLDWWDN